MKELEEKELLSKISNLLWAFYRSVCEQNAIKVRDLLDKYTEKEAERMFFYIQDKIIEQIKRSDKNE